MNTLTHLVILGRQPELGLVELESVLGATELQPFGKTACLTTIEPVLPRFGGMIKVGEILYSGPHVELEAAGIAFELLVRTDAKTTFGLSFYGTRMTPRAVLAAGLELKKSLKQFGPVRMVAPTEGSELTAAQLIHNKVIQDGFELMVVTDGGRMVIARTTAVQDIDAYAARDHGRPARDAQVGMLPPKLAQILLNTTSGFVVDPFCGTGVVLQEALLMGRAAAGSDLSAEMVRATQTNLEWLVTQVDRPLPKWSVTQADAQTTELPHESLAVVSEGYLGTNLSSAPTVVQLAELDQSISLLYRETLSNLAKQLERGAEVSLCVPNWRNKGGWYQPGIVDEVSDLGYTFKVFKHAHGTLRYARADQIVGRQLLLLTRS